MDVLVVGSGGGGMTAALTANASGLDALVIEKSPQFGGSTALSGGGIWVPGAPAQRRAGYWPSPEGVVEYLRQITDGLVSEARLRRYVEAAPQMLEFLEKLSPWLEFVWKPGYADYYPELPGGSELGSTINVPPIDLRALGDDEQRLLTPLALAPKGIWLGPKGTSFVLPDPAVLGRQRGVAEAGVADGPGQGVRGADGGDRAVAGGAVAAGDEGSRDPALAGHADARTAHGCKRSRGWCAGPARRRTAADRCAPRRVILASGGFDHDMARRKEHQPVIDQDWSFGNPAALGEGIRAGEKVGAATELMDEAWWFPAIQWPDGRMQFMLNERMMPAQFIVNGDGKRFINEAAPYMDFGHAMIEGQKSGVTHIPCWLVTDHRSFNRYVVGGHLPIPKIPGAPVPTGRKVPAAWLDSGVVKAASSWEELAEKIGVPAQQLRATATRFNELARRGHDDDFNRGDSVYDNYYGDPTLPNPNLYPLGDPPYYAFRIVLGDLGTSGGLRTDEFARVLRADDTVVPGLYAVGNVSAPVMGRSYAGAGATIGPAMTFGYVAAKHIAEQPAARSLYPTGP
ncbi:FAD-dependent oxidoreductase [Mycobacterium kiyosense]